MLDWEGYQVYRNGNAYVLGFLASPDICVGEEAQDGICAAPLWLRKEVCCVQDGQVVNQRSDLAGLDESWELRCQLLPRSVVRVRELTEREAIWKEAVV